MKLSSKEALNMLEELDKDSKNKYWIEHSICVGNSGGKIAQALYEKGYDVNIDKAKTLGYIHDIGKYSNDTHGHVMRGYNFLKEKGYDDEYCNICLTHSFLNNDILCTAGGVPNITGCLRERRAFLHRISFSHYSDCRFQTAAARGA